MTIRAVLALLSLAATPALAVEMRMIPGEYEATTGTGLALNNAGYAANDPHAAVRANPALLPLDRQYSVSAGYHWPASGRDFYQASVVDSKTSSVAAGVSYTGFMDDYVYARDADQDIGYDSPLVRRGVVGLGQLFGAFSLGAGATYVEANKLAVSGDAIEGDDEAKGVGLNLGAATGLSTALRLGASVENMSNRKLRDYMPRTYRAGAAYQATKEVTAYLDFRQRDRVLGMEAPLPTIGDSNREEREELEKTPERMLIGSFSAQVQDFLRVMASYGQSLSDERRSLSGGVAVVNKSFNISYTASRPYMNESTAHQAISLGVDMAM